MTSEESEPSDSALVTRLSPKLSGKQRRYLRGLAHHLNPVVLVGQNGVTDGLIQSFETALLTHELIKVKVHDADEVEGVAELLFEKSGAQLAQRIGKTLVFFRAHPKKPVISLPGSK